MGGRGVISVRREALRRAPVRAGFVVLVCSLVGLGTVSTASSTAAAFPGGNGRIVFTQESVAGDHTQLDVFTVLPDGTQVQQLSATDGRNEMNPVWSSDGASLALARSRAPFGPGSLWVMNADGSGKRQLTAGIDARDPSWNPTGTRLVYDSRNDLYTLRVSDGLGRRRLTSGPAWDFEPSWAPTGADVAFTRGLATGDPGDIYLLHLRTGQVTRVTHSPAYDHQVAWAPGGARLVFERDYAHSASIFTVRPDGSGLRRLTSGRHFDISPAWAPNGRWIVFGRDSASGLDALWVMRRDGTGLRQMLSVEHAALGFPDWQPNP
jgi:Tol biopolymer transport system component